MFADRIKETTTTTGTGTINLNGSVSGGFQTFVTGIGSGNKCYYCIQMTTLDQWEVGIGTVTDSSPDTLSRDTVLASSNAGALVNFSAGTKEVFCTLPAQIILTPVLTIGISSNNIITTGTKLQAKTVSQYNRFITGCKIISDVACTAVVDILKNGVSITGSEKPSLTASDFNDSFLLTSWDKTINENDIFVLNVISNDVAKSLSIHLKTQ